MLLILGDPFGPVRLQDSGMMGHLCPFKRTKNTVRMVNVTPNAKHTKSLKQHIFKSETERESK